MVVAGNDFLADCALRAGVAADRVRVIPTCVAPGRYEPRPPGGASGRGLELVWIGSSSTLQGIEQRRPLWERLAREVPGVRFKSICDRAADLGSMPVTTVAWDSATEARELAAADVGVTWVPDDLWSRGKCGLKALQYMAAGLPVLANPVGVHTEMVRPGVNGLLPAGDDDWVSAVRLLADDPEGRLRMGRAARLSAETDYSVAAWEGAVVAALAGSSPIAAPNLARPQANARGARVSTARSAWRCGASG
jgi:hypothetical protein